MNANQFGSWEDAVKWLLEQPDKQELVKACYYDSPALSTAVRFWNSDEWQAIRGLLPLVPGKALDVGAGNGIASFALAKDGWDTTAIEPDPSDLVGSGAIRRLAAEAGLKVEVVQESGEFLPFSDATFNVIHARQVLHHANDIEKFCRELFRVLKPGGMFVATREHVISCSQQLPQFLEQHPLHNLYGGENAFLLKDYKKALVKAGFRLEKILGPFDTVINYAPFTKEILKDKLTSRIKKFPACSIINLLLFNDLVFDTTLKILSIFDRRPGRLFSFVVRK